MSDAQRFGWADIDGEFEVSMFAAADVEPATRKADRRLPGFS